MATQIFNEDNTRQVIKGSKKNEIEKKRESNIITALEGLTSPENLPTLIRKMIKENILNEFDEMELARVLADLGISSELQQQQQETRRTRANYNKIWNKRAYN